MWDEAVHRHAGEYEELRSDDNFSPGINRGNQINEALALNMRLFVLQSNFTPHLVLDASSLAVTRTMVAVFSTVMAYIRVQLKNAA